MRGFIRAALVAAVLFDYLTPASFGLFQADSAAAQVAPAQSGGTDGGTKASPGDAFIWQREATPTRPFPQGNIVDGINRQQRMGVNPDGSINVKPDLDSSPAGSGGFTITSSSVTYVAPGQRRLLAIHNESATVSIACNFGGTAALNTAGNWTIPSGQTLTFPAGGSNYVPSDAVNCISGAATSPATIMVH